jgi:hypothetical protein
VLDRKVRESSVGSCCITRDPSVKSMPIMRENIGIEVRDEKRYNLSLLQQVFSKN